MPRIAANQTAIGRLPASQRLNLAIGLPLRNQEALTRLLQQIYNPSSPNYRHYLTPEEFAARFGPSEADYEAVAAFAETNGLKVTTRHSNRVLLDVEGTVADIEKTLHVRLNNYTHPSEARTFYAPDSEPSLDLPVRVLHIGGLDNASLPRPRLHATRLDQTKPAASPRLGSGPSGTYQGGDFRAAYAPGVTLDGTGQKVGLLQFAGYAASDITNYEAQAGLPSVTLSNVLLDGFNGLTTGSGGEVEVSLDIEMAISMAPGLSAVIVYMAGPNGSWHDMLNRMATDNAARQLSCSWYDTSVGLDTVADQIFQQMAAQGQSFFNASGDYDAYTGPILFPGETPYLTQVGGTTLTTTGPGGARVSEQAWNWGGGIGTAGGISTRYSIPAWQTGVDMTASLGSTTNRNTPDIALTADNVYVVAHGFAHNVGGTSCAAPLWAGFCALINQQAAEFGRPGPGLINAAVYALGLGTGYGAAFYDITNGNNFTAASPTRFPAVAGYDLCTGWGTPNGQGTIDALEPPDPLEIVPAAGLANSGRMGGPFTFGSQSLTLTNLGTNAFSWTLANPTPWLDVLPGGGTLNADGSTTSVTASLNAAASNLLAGHYVGTVWFTNLNTGDWQSRQFPLTVLGAPVVTNPPAGQTVFAGSNVTFTVGIEGWPPLYYQWMVSGTNVPGGTGQTLALTGVSTDQAGNYFAVVSNSFGSVTSAVAPLSVLRTPVFLTGNYLYLPIQTNGVFLESNQLFQPFNTGVKFNPAGTGGATGVEFWKSESGSYNTVAGVGGVNYANTGRPVQTGFASASISNLSTADLQRALISAVVLPGLTFSRDVSFGTDSKVIRIVDTLQNTGASTFTNVVVLDTADPNPDIAAPTNATSSTLNDVVSVNTANDIVVATGPNSGLSVGFGSDSGVQIPSAAGLNNTSAYSLMSVVDPDGASANIDINLVQNYGGLAPGQSQSVAWSMVFGSSETEVLDNFATNLAPAILVQPATAISTVGGSATFTVTAIGSLPLNYVWQRNGAAIAGQTGTSCTINNVRFADAGSQFTCAISNNYGITTSSVALLGVPATLYSFGGTDGAHPYPALAQGADGGLYGTTRNGGAYGLGTVFELTTNGLTSLVTFNSNNGAYPRAGLLQAADGSFYGTTTAGGASNNGTVFQLTTNAGFTTVASFNDPTNGAAPYAGLVQGADGNLYGTTYSGGSGNGTVFRMTTNGALTTLVVFNGSSNGAQPFASLLLGQDGNFYGSTGGGGTNSSGGTVFRMTTDGALTSMHAFSMFDTNGINPGDMVQAADGNLYGVTSGTVFRMTTNGVFKTLASFQNGQVNGADSHAGLMQGADGIFYGTISGSGSSGMGRVFGMRSNGTLTANYSFSGADGIAPESALLQGLDGNLYGTTFGGGINFNGDPGSGNGTVFCIFLSPPARAPAIAAQPDSQGVCVGGAATFFVGAVASSPVSYAWQRNGAPIAGATQSTYAVTNLQPADSGSQFSCVVSNGDGAAQSSNAVLTVLPLFASGPLYMFNGPEGGYSNGRLVQGADGSFYGTTERGGTYGLGTVFKMSASGIATLYSFDSTNGANPWGALLLATDGNLYGTTRNGGTNNVGTVFRITTNAVFANLASFWNNTTGVTAGANPDAGLAQGTDGNFYGTTEEGGGCLTCSGGFGSVFRMTPDGTLSQIAYFASDSAHPRFGLVAGKDGNFYGITPGSPSGTVFQVTPNGTLTTLVRFSWASGAQPYGELTVGSDGNIYGTTEAGGPGDNGTVFRMTTNGALTTLASFAYPVGNPSGGLIQGSDGYFYGTAKGGVGYSMVFRMSADGTITNIYSFGSSNGVASTAALMQGSDGNLYGTTYYGGIGSPLTTGNGVIYRVLLANSPPAVSGQPSNVVCRPGTNAMFSVGVIGSQPFSYQWQFNGANLPGATSPVLGLINVQPANAGSYSVTITNLSGATRSSNALLSIAVPPTITRQPVTQLVTPGCPAAFIATVSGTTPLKYQWNRNGAPIFGKTRTNLTFTNVHSSDFAIYTLIASNAYGLATSSPVALVLDSLPNPGATTVQRFATAGIRVGVASVLANDTDADGDPLSVISVTSPSPAGGTVTLNGSSIYYLPAAGNTNADSFNYTVSDGHCGGTATGTVQVQVRTDSNPAAQGSIEQSANGSVRLFFDGMPGYAYRIQSTDSLVNPNWQDVVTLTADQFGTVVYVINTPTATASRYYRSVWP